VVVTRKTTTGEKDEPMEQTNTTLVAVDGAAP